MNVIMLSSYRSKLQNTKKKICLIPEKKNWIKSFLMYEVVRKILGVLKFWLLFLANKWREDNLKICEDFIFAYFILEQPKNF